MSEMAWPALCTWPAGDVSAWPDPDPPYPVTAPYRPQPGLTRLGSPAHGRLESRVLDADRSAPTALRAKWARLQRHRTRCVALTPALADAPDAVWHRVCAAANAIVDAQCREGAGRQRVDRLPLTRVGNELQASLAGWAMPACADAPFAVRALRPDARPVLEWIGTRPAAERPLHALGLALQEDVAVVEADSAATPAHASLLHVCWPSGWDPAAKIGLDFATIHAPVADASLLLAAALPLSRALLSQGPFVRFVWTIASDGGWSRHPAEVARSDAQPWFRCERQVSVPLAAWPGGPPGGGAVFLIRLHVTPLAVAADTPARLSVLRAALASMSPQTLEYKGLADRRAGLLEWFDARRAGGDTPV